MTDYHWVPLNKLDDAAAIGARSYDNRVERFALKYPDVYPTLWERNGLVHRLVQGGFFFNSRKNVYASYHGPEQTMLLQLNKTNLPQGTKAYVTSEHSGLIIQTNAQRYLQELGITPQELVAAGLQKVQRVIQDSFRQRLEALVTACFPHGPQVRRA